MVSSVSRVFLALSCALLCSSGVFAHMQMSSPPPRLSTFSPFYLAAGNVDYSMTAPLFADGSNFPCKAYPAGVITGTLTAGTTLTVSIVGTANHNGGHCQFAVSYDNGQTWVVLLTVIHNCLGGASMNDPFLFNVPIPVGVPGCQSCVFAWSWINAVGNREYYMNCADVKIVQPAGIQAVGFTGPQMFVAQLPGKTLIPEFNLLSNPNVDGAQNFDKRCNVTVWQLPNGKFKQTISTGNGCGQFVGPTLAPISTPTPSTSPAPTSATTPAPVTAVPTSSIPTVAPTLPPTPVPGTGLVATARKVVYIDFRDVNYNNGSVTVCAAIAAGYNVINLAFWLLSGPADMALVWFQLPAATQISTQQYARSMGASLVVAAGGATDLPYAQISGQAYGTAVARFALANHLDGVDFDMENFGPGLTASGLSSAACIQWLIDATIAARTVLGPNAIISHAPQAPYFGKIGSALQNPWTLTSGGYSAVYAGAGSSISFFNIQFYNQGPTCYVTYTGLFKMSLDNGVGCTAFPGTSVSEIFSYGIPLYKIVVGKFNLPSDASTGFVSAPTLGQWFTTANQELGYNSGVMVWSYQQSTSAMWIKAAWPNAPALPITGVPTVGPTAAPPTSAPTSAPQPTVPSLPTAVPTTAPTAAPVTQAPTSTPSAGPTNVPITAAPTSAPTPVVTMAPTVAPIQPTLIPAGTANGMCNATDPSFVCTSGCALFQCIPNQGIRVVIPCPGGTACMNGACGFGQCINGISVMRNTDATGTAATPTTAAAAPDFQWAWIAVPVAAASLILIVLIARRCGCCLGVQKSEPSTGGVAHGRRIQRASQELATSVVAPVSSSVPPSTLPGIKTNEIKPIAGLHRRDGSAGLHDISLQLCSPTRATHARRRSRVDIV